MNTGQVLNGLLFICRKENRVIQIQRLLAGLMGRREQRDEIAEILQCYQDLKPYYQLLELEMPVSGSGGETLMVTRLVRTPKSLDLADQLRSSGQ